jgi:hypothetical protein
MCSLQTTVYRIVLLNGGVQEFDRVLKSFRDTEDNQERKYAMFSLGATKDVSCTGLFYHHSTTHSNDLYNVL